MVLDRPVEFVGTDKERRANFDSHNWARVSPDEVACYDCDAALWHVAASYPCGEEPPRELVETGE